MMSELCNFIEKNIVTIIGLALTYLGLKKNFIDNFKLQRTENQLDKINSLSMKIQECIDKSIREPILFKEAFDEIGQDIVCYGSKKSLSIFIFLKEYVVEHDSAGILHIFVYLSLLLAQVRQDTIGEVVNPELLIKMQLQLGDQYN
nr:hypothetical protein [uncultured Cellulosilyticum sp.]